MANLYDLKSELKTLLVNQGISAVIKALKNALPEVSPVLNEVILIESRLNEANKSRIRNIMSDQDLQLVYNKIRSSIIELINKLESEDFSTSSLSSKHNQKNKIQTGSILYRIPNKMKLERESKCVVRIAINEEMIIRNIDLDEHVKLENIRISDIMQVELIDPTHNHPFEIRTISSTEQFIDDDNYTEWIFLRSASSSRCTHLSFENRCN
jgi:hypothetical protein